MQASAALCKPKIKGILTVSPSNASLPPLTPLWRLWHRWSIFDGHGIRTCVGCMQAATLHHILCVCPVVAYMRDPIRRAAIQLLMWFPTTQCTADICVPKQFDTSWVNHKFHLSTPHLTRLATIGAKSLHGYTCMQAWLLMVPAQVSLSPSQYVGMRKLHLQITDMLKAWFTSADRATFPIGCTAIGNTYYFRACTPDPWLARTIEETSTLAPAFTPGRVPSCTRKHGPWLPLPPTRRKRATNGEEHVPKRWRRPNRRSASSAWPEWSTT